MTENIESTWANKLVFLLLCAAIVWTTLLYGTVHPPVIALFYLTAALTAILWAVDGFSSGVFRFNKSLLQIPLLAISLYGFFQIIPFGTLATAAGVEDIPRTISPRCIFLRFLFFSPLLSPLPTRPRV
jgi:hypothetical protein